MILYINVKCIKTGLLVAMGGGVMFNLCQGVTAYDQMFKVCCHPTLKTVYDLHVMGTP